MTYLPSGFHILQLSTALPFNLEHIFVPCKKIHKVKKKECVLISVNLTNQQCCLVLNIVRDKGTESAQVWQAIKFYILLFYSYIVHFQYHKKRHQTLRSCVQALQFNFLLILYNNKNIYILSRPI